MKWNNSFLSREKEKLLPFLTQMAFADLVGNVYSIYGRTLSLFNSWGSMFPSKDFTFLCNPLSSFQVILILQQKKEGYNFKSIFLGGVWKWIRRCVISFSFLTNSDTIQIRRNSFLRKIGHVMLRIHLRSYVFSYIYIAKTFNYHYINQINDRNLRNIFSNINPFIYYNVF